MHFYQPVLEPELPIFNKKKLFFFFYLRTGTDKIIEHSNETICDRENRDTENGFITYARGIRK